MTRMTHALPALLLAFAGLSPSAPARAAESYDNCTGTIDHLPASITTQGVWCLKGDLSTAMNSGFAISVLANNVTIDCNGFKIGGLAAGPVTDAVGIYSNDQQNVVVRNCNLRGFAVGVSLGGYLAAGNVVEDSRFDNNLLQAISVWGPGSVARHNVAMDSGGGTSAYGVHVFVIGGAEGASLIDNTISGAASTPGSNGNVRGIQSNGGTEGENGGATISGNRISGLVADGTGTVVAIARGGKNGAAIVGNHLFSNGHGSGITCGYTDQDSVSGNVILGFATAIVACPDDGNFIRGTTE